MLMILKCKRYLFNLFLKKRKTMQFKFCKDCKKYIKLYIINSFKFKKFNKLYINKNKNLLKIILLPYSFYSSIF